MCWAMVVSKNPQIDFKDPEVYAAYNGNIIRSGRNAPIIVATQPGVYKAENQRFGLNVVSSQLDRSFTFNARIERMSDSDTWRQLMRRRFILPIDAYCEVREDEHWPQGEAGFLVGVYDPRKDGGMVVITEPDPDSGTRRLPVLVGSKAAKGWLDAAAWDALPNLINAPRIRYTPLDVFEDRRLSAEARNEAGLLAA